MAGVSGLRVTHKSRHLLSSYRHQRAGNLAQTAHTRIRGSSGRNSSNESKGSLLSGLFYPRAMQHIFSEETKAFITSPCWAQTPTADQGPWARPNHGLHPKTITENCNSCNTHHRTTDQWRQESRRVTRFRGSQPGKWWPEITLMAVIKRWSV